MNSPQCLLRPVSPGFIAFNFVLAFLSNLMPRGHMQRIPDLVALVLVFWNIHQPCRMDIVVASLLGLLIDVHGACLLGEHAMTYTVLSYFVVTVHRCVLRFTVLLQVLHVLPLLVLAHVVPIVTCLLVGAHLSDWQVVLLSLIEAALWPFASAFLPVPQRRPENVDETRPI